MKATAKSEGRQGIAPRAARKKRFRSFWRRIQGIFGSPNSNGVSNNSLGVAFAFLCVAFDL
ncbi:MAG TPA: hypothetical protein VFO57_00350 [Burkholderiales bacterium]|nr:hypothetical protein [Burkholderiales bacterium]